MVGRARGKEKAGVNVLILGATGSAGGCVLRISLASSAVTEVRAIGRRPTGVSHPKLREIRHDSFNDYTAIQPGFAGIDACFYCLGKSVQQVSGEAEYRTITYEYAMATARALRAESPAAVFHFISGSGASLNSRFMWARVKAETERDLIAQFDAVCYRPAAIDGMPSVSEPIVYKLLRPVGRYFFSGMRRFYVTGDDIGRAMLEAQQKGLRGRVIDNAGIRDLADRSRAIRTL
jgi:uncharacterized protein YbjT (DUF2867 family)